MKKIICLALTFTAILTLSTETLAFRGIRNEIKSDEFRISVKPLNRKNLTEIKFVPIKTVNIESELKNNTLPDYYPTANLTVVDSNQVKVKYDFWIVKILKKLFN